MLLLGFQKQLRLGENPFARLLGLSLAPGVVEQRGLPRGPGMLCEYMRHPDTLFNVDARHRSQIPHGDLRSDAPFADLLLHRFRQCFHQCQAARHPGRAAVETPRQFFNRVAELSSISASSQPCSSAVSGSLFMRSECANNNASASLISQTSALTVSRRNCLRAAMR